MRTSELIGPALNWAVARALGKRPHIFIYPITKIAHLSEEHDYSTEWSQGGPIIERERILLKPTGDTWTVYSYCQNRFAFGPTALVAAMRCYVASKLGDEVEVPKELES